MRRCALVRRAAAAALAAALLVPAGAAAQRSGGSFFAGAPVDGPSADVLAVGDLSIARDGTGAVAYTRRDEGLAHVFVGVLDGGAVQSVGRVDPGLPGIVGTPALGASDGGRLVIAWATGDGVYAAVRPAIGQPFGPPLLVAPGGIDPSVDLAVSGLGYLVWARAGEIEAAFLARGATTQHHEEREGTPHGSDRLLHTRIFQTAMSASRKHQRAWAGIGA